VLHIYLDDLIDPEKHTNFTRKNCCLNLIKFLKAIRRGGLLFGNNLIQLSWTRVCSKIYSMRI